MKRENREDICLKDAFGETPDMCRQAVLDAVGTYREEQREARPIKKPWVSFALAAALLMLTVGSALALTRLFSVRDSVAGGEPSREFEEKIQPLKGEMRFDGVTLTMGDAVFDGTNLYFTLNAEAAEDAEIYLLPELTAVCGGEEREMDFGVLNMSFTDGVLQAPALNIQIPQEWNVRGELYGNRAREAVEWRFTVRAFRPLWPLVLSSEDGQTEEGYFANRMIQVENVFGDSSRYPYPYRLDAYFGEAEDYVRDRDGWSGEGEWNTQMAAELLTCCGAFEAAGEETVTFTLAAPQPTLYPADRLIPYLQVEGKDDSGYDIQFTALETTFMRFRYEMTVTRASDGAFSSADEVPLWFAMYDQDGRELTAETGPHLELSADRKAIIAWNEGQYISDQPLTAVTFVPFRSAYYLKGQYVREGEDFSKAFTVSIRQK